MDINELESFKLSDAVSFHKELNPKLWEDEKLDPEVRDQLMLIAEDFVEYLGISNLKVKDVTISGSNAAYSYTPHSDLDLHVLVDFNELPNNEVYQELFTAKKTLYNEAHDITVRDVPVELYVQDTSNPVQSLGEYSIVHDKWIRIPKKRRANFDEVATKAKYEKLGDLIELAIKSKDPKRVNDTIALVKRYRKSGLDKAGEFGPENLAYKAVRKQGLVQALHDLKAELHGEKLSIEEDADKQAATLKIQKHLNKKYGANLDLDGKLGPLTLKSINKFMPRAKTGLADEPNKTTAVQGKKLKEAPRTFQPQTTPIEQLISDYNYFTSFGTVHLEKQGETPEARHELLALVQRLQKDARVFGSVVRDKKKMEANRDTILNHIYQMMQYAIPILKKNLPADDWEAKRGQINAVLTAYNNVSKINEAESDVSKASVVQFKTLPGPGKPRHSFRVVYDGKVIAYGEVEKDSVHDDEHGASVQEIVVHSRYRRMGIASKIYSAIEHKFGYELHPSDDVKPDGQEFWKARGNLGEASGYIPSEKEKNDPRFKTALTVDVRPDAIKKNAKAFGFKISRAGIPPQARADGKIAENLMREFKTFLGEQQEEMFPGYDEQHREKRLGNWLAKSWGVQNGKPQTFYHATTKDFDTFNTSGTGFASALGMAYEVERHGSFFAVDPKFAEGFIEDPNTGRVKEGGRVLPVHLSIQSPIDLRDDALSRMLSDEETVEEFKANDIDLRSIYNHFYELERWELFDGPEGAEFIDNLQKLGFDGAIINESIPNDSNAKSGQVWVAFNPNQVKSIHNRGSFSPDDNRLVREDQKNTVPKIGYHVTATKNLPIIQQNGIKADKRGSSYVWDSREMAEWFMDFQNDEGLDRTILKIDMSGLAANLDPEAEDMSEWSSKFKPGTNGGAWIISGPIPSDKIIG
jgi:predicted nucleotidyltransferase